MNTSDQPGQPRLALEAADTTDRAYESPRITDHGSLTELTLSGSAPLADAFGGAAGGGS